MADQELKDIHVIHTPHPRRVMLFAISIISLLALVIIVFILNKNGSPKEVPTTVINTQPTPAIERGSISDSGTYAADGFTFDYPTDYKVEEKENGFYVISKSNETDISIDSRKLDGINSDFNQAITSARNRLTEQAERQTPNGIKMFGKIKEGYGQGIPILSAYLQYGQGALVVETSGEIINEAVFDQVIASLVIK